MTIEEADFRLEFDEGCSFFDLYLMHVINAKDAAKRREELKLEGYSLTLDTALNRIIKYRLNKKLDVVDLKTYVKEFKDECKKIRELCGEYHLC